MTGRAGHHWSNAAHAMRVAAFTSLLFAAVYASICVVFDVVDAHHLVAQVDARLHDRLNDTKQPSVLTGPPVEADDDHDVDAAPVLLWRVDDGGHATALSDSAPALPDTAWSRLGRPTTARVGLISFRFQADRVGGTWVVAGQSLTETSHIQAVVATAEAIAGPFLLAVVFLVALTIGLQASRPVEEARRQQLQFTADASHELRTPLSVIEAEVGLALRKSDRSAAEYRGALERVGGESRRLRTIVEDLLWLARFDSEPTSPTHEPVDLVAVATLSTDRFAAVASQRDLRLSVRDESHASAHVDAPGQWIDRLTGVLVDNACRYADRGGDVRVTVMTHGQRVSLVVEDSGPGIDPEERDRLFDRFHRATDEGSGSGLGLAIADVVVRSTGGRWSVGESRWGGARMEVSWHRIDADRPPRQTDPPLDDGSGDPRRPSVAPT